MSAFEACIKHALLDQNLDLFRSLSNALWTCCMSPKEKDVKLISESVDILFRLVETLDEELVVPLLGIIEECSSVV